MLEARTRADRCKRESMASDQAMRGLLDTPASHCVRRSASSPGGRRTTAEWHLSSVSWRVTAADPEAIFSKNARFTVVLGSNEAALEHKTGGQS